MRISFTGTMEGMNTYQECEVEKLVKSLPTWGGMNIFVHGACKGADIQFHKIVRKVWGKNILIAAFPSTSKSSRIDEIRDDCQFVADPRPPLLRNPDIVDAGCDVLIATPLQMQEILRSGTWATVRYARKKNIEVKIAWRERT